MHSPLCKVCGEQGNGFFKTGSPKISRVQERFLLIGRQISTGGNKFSLLCFLIVPLYISRFRIGGRQAHIRTIAVCCDPRRINYRVCHRKKSAENVQQPVNGAHSLAMRTDADLIAILNASTPRKLAFLWKVFSLLLIFPVGSIKRKCTRKSVQVGLNPTCTLLLHDHPVSRDDLFVQYFMLKGDKGIQ